MVQVEFLFLCCERMYVAPVKLIYCCNPKHKFLDKAAVIDPIETTLSYADANDSEKNISKENPLQLRSVKLLVRVMPIWIFSLMFMVHIT